LILLAKKPSSRERVVGRAATSSLIYKMTGDQMPWREGGDRNALAIVLANVTRCKT
jgi:hypothetical protein